MKQDTHYSDTPGKNPGFCLSDCSACAITRLGDSPQFRQLLLDDGQQITSGHKEASCIVFLMRGSLLLENSEGDTFILQAGQCYFYTRNELARIIARSSCVVILLEFVRRMRLCEQDWLKELKESDHAAMLPLVRPMLRLNVLIKEALTSIFRMEELALKPCFHYLKMMEICMMMTHLYTPKELSCFFRSIIRPADDFRAFVLTHYNRVKTVAEFADLSGMSKSVFQKKFTEVFGQTVAHWMMKQKAEGIRLSVRGGMTSTKELIHHFGFSNESVFTHFCKTYMGNSPANMIAAETRFNQQNRGKTSEKNKSIENKIKSELPAKP